MFGILSRRKWYRAASSGNDVSFDSVHFVVRPSDDFIIVEHIQMTGNEDDNGKVVEEL